MRKVTSGGELAISMGGIRKAIESLRGGDERRRAANQIAVERTREHDAQQEFLCVEQKRREAFQREAIPHMNSLYNYALRMTLDSNDAEDLVQETYLKAFRFFEKFQEGTNCKAWLFRIMKNSYINRYRKAQKSPETVDYDTVEEFYYKVKSDQAATNDLSVSIFNNLLDDEVTLAIESLPEDFRTVVILCDIEGLTYEEIAEFVDCPVGTVRSRLHRGRKLLRDALVGYASSRGYGQVPDDDSRSICA